MRKFFYYAAVFSIALFSSCEKDVEVSEVEENDENITYSFSVNINQPQTKVTYTDNIGNQNSPFNPNADGKNTFTMNWRDGDELVAIRWKEPYDEYIVLKANIPSGGDLHTISFDTQVASDHFKTKIENKEKFILIHGDFVFDPDEGNSYADPKIDFPTSEVTKAGYANHIHHGGKVSDNDLTFRNQDGTLENLRKHEYMVAEGYIHFSVDDGGNAIVDGSDHEVHVSLTDSKDGGNPVSMHIAHTLLRLTLFLPDEDFDSTDPLDDDLVAISIKDASMHNIFHRYFRMHPNATKEQNEKNFWNTSYNNNADKEENPYIRINLVDESKSPETYGVSHKTENILRSQGFDPKKPVSVPVTNGPDGKSGHYVTLYFSLPSRHIGVNSNNPCDLVVTAFTRTHAYRSVKKYKLPDAAMLPGTIVPLNVKLSGENVVKFKAITDPELGITFSPGFVYANKVDGSWKYGIYQNQGQYAGMSHQTLDFGEYFTYGSVDPTEAAKYVNNVYQAPTQHVSDFKDVASLVIQKPQGASEKADGASGLYSMMTKQEADRVLSRLQSEVAKGGLFLGYYYYDDGNGNTRHQARGSHNEEILNAASNNDETLKTQLKTMSASVGIYIGINRQPSYLRQDDYVFLPNSKQMSNNIPDGDKMVKGPSNGTVQYILPKDYTDLNTNIETELIGTAKLSSGSQFKFSTYTRTAGTNPYRFQVWTNTNGNALESKSTNVNNSVDGTYARPIRPVIY